MSPNSGRIAAVALVVTVLAGAACSGDDAVSQPDTTTVAPSSVAAGSATSTTASATTAPVTTPAPATFSVLPGVEQVAVIGADEGTLVLETDDGDVVADGAIDAQGSVLWRDVPPGTYRVRRLDPAELSEPVDVAAPDDPPPTDPGLQPLLPAGGFGYVTVRDGTTLSANVLLPGPADAGPYPTVVEYSGYEPSNPDATGFGALFTALGYAYVGVNMRGTGCSGGSYQFFEPVQSLDGYDVIEAVAAQPWVAHQMVGMVGVSYPGISQLFVAATRPPHLAAITPFSVLDDAYRSTLYPGGMLNTGFAVEWTAERMRESAPFGQEWAERRSQDDDTCLGNQQLRLQNPDLVALIEDHPYYDPAIADEINPSLVVDRIEVPVLMAGAFQDEQTGGRFPSLIGSFTSSPRLDVTVTNGLHTESILSAPIFARLVEFLDLYVARRTPSLAAAGLVYPVLVGGLTGGPAGPLGPDRFAGLTHAEALAAFEAEPTVRVLFEEGGADPARPNGPSPRFSATFSAWPPSEADVTTWTMAAGGGLDTGVAPEGTTSYVADPTAVAATFYTGDGNGIWATDVRYDWPVNPPGTAAVFTTEPLAESVAVVGPGSVDLWLAVDDVDTDVEVTVSEVRPDGTETYVQSGWLRASHRALDVSASSELRPVHTHLQADAAPLEVGTVTALRVELFPMAHVFRAGSRLRLTIDAPGGNRGVWELRSVSDGETVTISHGPTTPSRLVLAVVPGLAAPPDPAACGVLRGQPCRSVGR
jgi:uncharacterized protein